MKELSHEKITVIIPVYNAQQTLGRCIDSLLRQMYTNFEILLVDDGSTDDSAAICDQYQEKNDKVKVLHKPNGGPAAARNTGLDYVMGDGDSEWIAFADSDDWVHERYLKDLHRACIENDTSIAICKYREVSCEQDALVPLEDKKSCVLCTEDVMCDHADVSAVVWGKLYRKELFRNIRYPDELTVGEDSATTYRILFQCEKIALVETPLYYYYNNPCSLTHQSESLEQRLKMARVLSDQVDFFQLGGYMRAYRFKKEILIASLAGSVMLCGKEHPQKDRVLLEFSRQMESFCKEFNVSKYYFLNKYFGIRRCSFKDKLGCAFYRIKQALHFNA